MVNDTKKVGSPPPHRSQFYPNLGAAAKLTLTSRITDAHESLPPLGSVTTPVRQHVSTYLESRGRRFMGRHHFVNSALCTTSVGLGGSRRVSDPPGLTAPLPGIGSSHAAASCQRPGGHRWTSRTPSSQSPGWSSCSVSGVGWNYSAPLEEAAIVCESPPSSCFLAASTDGLGRILE